MMTIRPEELALDLRSYMYRAHHGESVRIAGRDGTCVVLISDIQHEMLNQALNLCIDHPEWISDG